MPGGCAQATTAREAAFRIDQPNGRAREILVVPLGDAASRAVAGLAGQAGVRIAAPEHAGIDGVDTLVLVAAPDGDAAGAVALCERAAVRGIGISAVMLHGRTGPCLRQIRQVARMLVTGADEETLRDLIDVLRGSLASRTAA